jgi:hypothetical protein
MVAMVHTVGELLEALSNYPDDMQWWIRLYLRNPYDHTKGFLDEARTVVTPKFDLLVGPSDEACALIASLPGYMVRRRGRYRVLRTFPPGSDKFAEWEFVQLIYQVVPEAKHGRLLVWDPVTGRQVAAKASVKPYCYSLASGQPVGCIIVYLPVPVMNNLRQFYGRW